MEELTEVITAAECHPHQCNVFVYSSSKGTIRLCDMRAAALCDRHSKCEYFKSVQSFFFLLVVYFFLSLKGSGNFSFWLFLPLFNVSRALCYVITGLCNLSSALFSTWTSLQTKKANSHHLLPLFKSTSYKTECKCIKLKCLDGINGL